MGLRFDPIGGGRFKQLVDQIIQAERQPVRNLEARKARVQTKMKLFEEFKGKFNSLQGQLDGLSSFKRLVEYKVDLGDGKDLIDVTINKEKAQPGSYVMEVVELAERSAMISNGFEDPDAKNLGIGYVTIQGNNGEDFEVFVDEKDASLKGVARLINDIRDSPIRATVLKDSYDLEKPWKLILSAKDDGDLSGVEFPHFYFLDGDEDFWIDDERGSRNAIVAVNGFDVEAESNDVVDFFEGINVKLKQAREGSPFTLTIREDVEQISGKVGELFNNLNTVLDFINQQNKVDKDSDTSTTFTGDTGLQSIEYRLRNLLHEAFPSHENVDAEDFKLVWLHDMGVEFTREGKITFNKEEFTQAVEKDFDSVAEALSGEYGFVNQLKSVVRNYTLPGVGLLALKENGMQSQIRQIDDNIDNQERILGRRAQALTDRFARLQSSLGALQQQQQFMQSTLGGGGGALVSQLLGG